MTCDSGLVKGAAKAPDIVEEDIDIMMSTNVTGLINMSKLFFLSNPYPLLSVSKSIEATLASMFSVHPLNSERNADSEVM